MRDEYSIINNFNYFKIMANERKTEIIVRKHFDNFLDIDIEEQKSDNLKIDKLLKLASKKGVGNGRPDFLISYKTNPDLLIVIECKADISKHKSKNKDKYAEFAVDGVLLYASYLSKGFDVLAIAVSGETKQSLKVSHFLHLKNGKKAISVFGDKLLNAEDYLNGYIKSDQKFKQDYYALLNFAKELNQKLHFYKIPEKDRALLISCILIALGNVAFKKSYRFYTTPKELANSLIQTVSNELERENIIGDKLENLNTQFSFIKIDTSLSKKDKVLKEIIDEIDENINNFIKTYKYFDVLGQLYIEFLRYANSDKGLGIVLTPPHITEFFADLAQVNKNSIAYDNCTGTGGFLISAMNRMIANAKGDEAKIKVIKEKQLIGAEYQSHIFALAVSNMYIHQDGKTNIINGSCFDEEVIKEVKSKKPTVGFLNPPYKSNKKTDIDELEFILNNLECLVDGGICVAIVPMQSALAQKGKVYELKKKLLEKHTLEAVLSMPNELFHNSNVGVNTCVMVFVAHKPHLKNKKTFFGYYKDDGFVKRKDKGRIDAYGKWENIKKEKWLLNFINRKNEAGFSVNKIVSAEMEWVAEAYMETDYSQLQEQDFINFLKNFLSFQIINNKENIYSVDSQNIFKNKKIVLDTRNWKKFAYNDIFNIKRGRRVAENLFGLKKYPLIGASQNYNGSNNEYIDEYDFDGVYLTVGNGGNTGCGQTFLQNNKFAVKSTVNILNLKNRKLNNFLGIFLGVLIKLERYRYNFGRGWSTEKMELSTIKLPVNKNKEPDWEFMENFIKTLPYSSSL